MLLSQYQMHTATCDVEGCTKSFTKDTQASADMAIRMHKSRIHKGGLQSRKADPKRKYRRTPAKVEMPALGFCPCCGFNLKVLQVAMSIASRS